MPYGTFRYIDGRVYEICNTKGCGISLLFAAYIMGSAQMNCSDCCLQLGFTAALRSAVNHFILAVLMAGNLIPPL